MAYYVENIEKGFPHSDPCIFCINGPETGTGPSGIEPERILKSYDSWWLVLQPEERRNVLVRAAGLLIARRAISVMTEATPMEFGEIITISDDACETLCAATGTTYTGQFRGGCSEGSEAGQSVPHAHYHLLPVSLEDPPEMKIGAGIGGAFGALRTLRMGNSE
jgi:diadenosine tetraphosphate (Ap4A) HIT family hydrolase